MPLDRRRSKSHAERAARIDTRELEARIRQWEEDLRTARSEIEDEMRREHGGRLPDGWGRHGG